MWNRRSWKKTHKGQVLERYHGEAARYMNQPRLLSALLDRVQVYLGKAIAMKVSGFTTLIQDVPLLIRLVRAYQSGRYRSIRRSSVIVAIAGLLYFLSPIDLIPDFLGAIGFIDDIAILGFVFASIQREIQAFRRWELAF